MSNLGRIRGVMTLDRKDILESVHSHTNSALEALGVEGFSGKEFRIIAAAYEQITRSFHDLLHLQNMTFVTEDEFSKFYEFNKQLSSLKLKSIMRLASAFHDTVYAHVDGGITPEIEKILSPYIEKTDDSGKKWKLKEYKGELPEHTKMVMDIFGVEPGQELDPGKNQNEFLSALFAAEMLMKKGLSMKHIAQVVTLIEATVPFRPNDVFAKLEGRLAESNKKYNLELTDMEVKETFRAAVFIANKDISNMAGYLNPDPVESFKCYIQNSWKIIPELNPSLRGTEFTPTQYRVALQGMQKFNELVSVDNIVHYTEEYPPKAEVDEFKVAISKNMDRAKLYLKTKVVSAAIVEALAIKSGAVGMEGAAQTSLYDFVNGIEEKLKINSPNVKPQKAKGPVIKGAEKQKRMVVLEALKNRGESSVAFGFDISPSPIGKFILERLSTADIDKAFAAVTSLANDDVGHAVRKMRADDFLRSCADIVGKDTLGVVVRSLAEATDKRHSKRADVLGKYADELEQTKVVRRHVR